MRQRATRHVLIAAVLIILLIIGAGYWFGRFDSSVSNLDEHILPIEAEAQPLIADNVDPPLPAPPPVAPAAAAVGEGVILGTVYLTAGDLASAFEVIVEYTPVSESGDATRQTVVTGDDGRFRLEELPFGTYFLLAQDDSGVAAASCTLRAEYPAREVVLVLQPGGSLGGVVVDNAGNPVAGAALVPYMHDGERPSREFREWPPLISAEDGAFLFPALPLVDWQFHVSAPCCAAQLSDPIRVGTLDARIVLEAGASVSGTVVNADIKALQPDVRVLAHLRNIDATPAEAVSDASGTFHFPALAVGANIIQIEAGDLVLMNGALRLDVPAKGLDDVILEVLPGGIVRGHVLDGMTGEGLPGTRISAHRAGQAAKIQRSSPADDTGAFELRGIEPGEYSLNVVASSALSPMHGGAYSKQVYVRPGETLEGVDFHVLRGLTVSGRVLYPSGAPAPGATVLGRGEHWQDSQSADAQGNFTLAGIKPGMNVELAATAQSWASKVSGPHTIRQVGIDGIELVLDRPREGLIEGVVVDKTGRPLAARVNAWNREGPLMFVPPSADTDSIGHFLIIGVGPGAYSLNVSMLGGSLSRPAMDVTVAPGQHLRNLRLVMDVRPGQDIAGRVVSEAREPVIAYVQLKVSLGPPNAFTSVSTQSGPDGRFRFRSLDPGTYGARAEAPGYAPGEVEDIQAGDEEVLIVLNAATTLSGQVLSTSGEPITRFDIAAITSGEPGPGNGLEGQYRPVSDPEGRFWLELEGESYALVVRAEGYQAGRVNVDYIVPGEQREDIVIQLEPGDPIRGAVVTGDGRAVPNAFIFLGPLPVSPYQMAPWATTVSDGNGAFEVYPSRRRPPIVVSAYHPTLGTGEAAVELGEDAVIVIEGSGSLRVHVRENGAPAAGVSLYITLLSGTTGYTANDDGDVFANDLAAGEVQVSLPDGTASQTVEIIAGQEAELLLDLDSTP